MIFDLIRSITYVILGLFVFFFMLGNISLMKLKPEKHIKTPHKIGQTSTHEPQENKDITNEIDTHNQQIIQKSNNECQSAKDQIMNIVLLKRQQEQGKTFLQGLTKQLAPFLDTEPKAPTLENFENYAPVDTPTNITPKQKELIQMRKGDNFDPKAANEHDSHYPSNFYSERRAPWSEKMGKDDLSCFFDTHAFDKSFDNLQKNAVICPDQWEKDTKTPKIN